ncbi:MAG: N-acetylglucosamine kinase, partial [Candidatus Zipacnadales bacterium]
GISMSHSSPLVAALEGGGSKTIALVLDLSGTVVAWGRDGSSVALYVGGERSAAAVEHALRTAVQAVDPTQVVVVSAAMIGKGYSINPWEAIKTYFPGARYESIAEGEAALRGATLSPVGAVVLSGTGAFGHAVGQGGHVGHVGGNGPLVGDEGSGYYLAVEAIRRALWSVDGRGEPTTLVEAICRHFDLPKLGWIIGRLYGPQAMGRHEIASLAPVVVAVARTGDAVARGILDDAAQLLAQQAVAAIHQVWAQHDGWEGLIPFGCTGGVLLGSPELRNMVAEYTRLRVSALEPREPRLPPVGGVALYALESAGVIADEEVVNRLAHSLPPEAGRVMAVEATQNYGE